MKTGERIGLVVGVIVIAFLLFAAIAGTLTNPLGAVGCVVGALALLGLLGLIRSTKAGSVPQAVSTNDSDVDKRALQSGKFQAAATAGSPHSSEMVNSKEYRGDYGPLLRPPSDTASALLSTMTKTEQSWLTGLLEHAQKWHESAAGETGLMFHPEARTAMWATALAKIADHYRDNHNQRALFFVNAAWQLSKYPVFAFNGAVLHMALGQEEAARPLLHAILRNIKISPPVLSGSS